MKSTVNIVENKYNMPDAHKKRRLLIESSLILRVGPLGLEPRTLRL